MEFTETKLDDSKLLIEEQAQNDLLITQKWAKFLGIVMFVITALLLVVTIIVMSSKVTISKLVPGGVGWIPLVYIILGGIYFAMGYFLFQFAVNAKRGIATCDNTRMNSAFRNLKRHYQIAGILTAVILAIYPIIFILAIVFSQIK